MIDYSENYFTLGILFQRTGSVLPQAFSWAVTNGTFAALIHWALRYFGPYIESELAIFRSQMDGVPSVWSGYTAVLSILIVFRNNQAYSRFWEGATLVNQTRGEWFNAISSLIAFCNQTEAKAEEVAHFQALLVRLASLLHCSAMQEVCEIDEDSLEILDPTGLNEESMRFLEIAHDRCEIILQWMQRLIIEAQTAQIIIAAPPILSRSFQELSRGVVNLNNVRKIRDIPFPFPYNQVLIAMLAIHWFITPTLAGFYVESIWWAFMICFFVTGGLWCVVYIAREIEQPFGEDPNDLPMVQIQKDFNNSLLSLMQPLAQKVPSFKYDKSKELRLTQRYVKDEDADSSSKQKTQVCSKPAAFSANSRQDSSSSLSSSGRQYDAGRQVSPMSDAFPGTRQLSPQEITEVIMEEHGKMAPDLVISTEAALESKIRELESAHSELADEMPSHLLPEQCQSRPQGDDEGPSKSHHDKQWYEEIDVPPASCSPKLMYKKIWSKHVDSPSAASSCIAVHDQAYSIQEVLRQYPHEDGDMNYSV